MAVILSGGKQNFSFGFDLKDKEFLRLEKLKFEENRNYFQLGKIMCDAWEKLSCLTVCEIKGWCVGGGVALAISCDLRLAETAAKFYVPEVERGLNMSWGSVPRLIALLGPAKTTEKASTTGRKTKFTNRQKVGPNRQLFKSEQTRA